MANFRCSIEMEPMTLNQGQLHLAREVAVGIVQNNEPQEASNIFIEGLKPVAATVLVVQETNGVDNKDEHDKDSAGVFVEKAARQCLCTAKIVESPDDQSMVKEPFTAPF